MELPFRLFPTDVQLLGFGKWSYVPFSRHISILTACRPGQHIRDIPILVPTTPLAWLRPAAVQSCRLDTEFRRALPIFYRWQTTGRWPCAQAHGRGWSPRSGRDVLAFRRQWRWRKS